MNFRGLKLESFVAQRDASISTHDEVCSVRGCYDYNEIGMAEKRIDGYAFCTKHADQIEGADESSTPSIDKPYTYHTPSPEGLARINHLRAHFSEGERLIREVCPESRHRSVALTENETTAMWAIKAVVFNDPASEVS